MFPSHLSFGLISFLALLPIMNATADQTCKINSIPSTTPTAQFTSNGNGTITDTKTGLIWKICSEGQSGSDCSGGSAITYNWKQALEHVKIVNSNGGFAGHTDWRLPNLNELRSIVERQCEFPAINLSLFPNISVESRFWSSTPFAYEGNYVLAMHFDRGGDSMSFKYETLQIRLVRSGQ